MSKSSNYVLPIASLCCAAFVYVAQQMSGASTGCLTAILIFTSLGLAIAALIRTSNAPVDENFDAKALWEAIAKLRVEVDSLRKQIHTQENVLKDSSAAKEDTHPGVAIPPPLKSVIVQPSRPAPEFRSPKAAYPVIPELPKAPEPEPAVLPVIATPGLAVAAAAFEVSPPPEIPALPELPLAPPALPVPEPVVFTAAQPAAIVEPIVPAFMKAEEPIAPEPAPEPEPVVAPGSLIPESMAPSRPQWEPLPAPVPLPLPGRPAFKPMVHLPPRRR
ncbi:MAG: hypothetical protein IPQ13_14865 [Holophagaceae bacterium]|nr:hypothetical protein [Holophagaceae bacterium]